MVITMKSNVLFAGIFLCCSVTVAAHVHAQVSCTIRSIEVVEPLRIQTIPGAPLTLVLSTRAVLSGFSEPMPVGRASAIVARALSLQVHIDGGMFRNKLSHGSLNEVARFMPIDSASGQSSGVSSNTEYEFRCTASLLLRASKKGCEFVFASPGVHEIVFGDPKGATATSQITVAESTAAEQGILDKLDKDPQVLLFLADPSDCSHATPTVAHLLESVLEQFPDTRLEKYISVALGVSKFCHLRQVRRESLDKIVRSSSTSRAQSPADIERAFREGYNDLAKYFHEPPAELLWSEFEFLAVWHKAQIELGRARNSISLAASETHIDSFVRSVSAIEGHRTSSTKWKRKVQGLKEMGDRVRAAIDRSGHQQP